MGVAAVGLIISFIKSNYVTGWQISVYLPFAMSKYQFAMQKRKIIMKQRIFQMSRTQKLSFSPWKQMRFAGSTSNKSNKNRKQNEYAAQH